jgi:hypothetical protein
MWDFCKGNRKIVIELKDVTISETIDRAKTIDSILSFFDDVISIRVGRDKTFFYDKEKRCVNEFELEAIVNKEMEEKYEKELEEDCRDEEDDDNDDEDSEDNDE